MNERSASGKLRMFLTFAGPAVLLFALVVLVPFVYGLYLTFTTYDGISSGSSFAGLANYIKVFTDGAFWKAMWITIRYMAVSVILINAVAFILAYFLTSGIRAQNFLRAAFFTPNLIGGIVLGFIWSFLFSRVMTSFGHATNLGVFIESWLTNPTKAFWALVIVTVWQYSGYMMLIYVAGFMNISHDLLEASSIDGATGWKKTRHIVLPLMVPSFVICLFLSIQRCFMVYDVNLSLTAGGPYNSTMMAAMYVYQQAFRFNDYSTGQAEAFILFVVVAIITVAQLLVGKRKEVDA